MAESPKRKHAGLVHKLSETPKPGSGSRGEIDYPVGVSQIGNHFSVRYLSNNSPTTVKQLVGASSPPCKARVVREQRGNSTDQAKPAGPRVHKKSKIGEGHGLHLVRYFRIVEASTACRTARDAYRVWFDAFSCLTYSPVKVPIYLWSRFRRKRCDLLDNPGRGPDSDTPGRYILGDDGTCANRAPLTDGNTR